MTHNTSPEAGIVRATLNAFIESFEVVANGYAEVFHITKRELKERNTRED